MTTLGNPWNGNTDATDPLVGADVKTWLDAIRTVVNGGIDNTNIAAGAAIALSKLEYGLLRHHRGASTQEKFMRGTKDVVLDNTTTNGKGTATITFATDCDNPTGATLFSVAPRVFALVRQATSPATGRFICCITGAATTTTATLLARTADAVASTATVTCEWIAIGDA